MHLHTFRERFGDLAEQARNEDASFEAYLLALCEEESRERRLNRIERLVRESRLPREKTRRALDLKRMDRKVGLQVHALVQGDFIDRRENVLALGNPGSAKTRLLCAIGHELIQGGRRVYFTTCNLLVQHLLRAKQGCALKVCSNSWGATTRSSSTTSATSSTTATRWKSC